MSNYPPEKQQGPYANIPQEGQGYNSNYGPPPPDMKTGQNFTGAPYYGAPVPMGDGGATSASAGPGHFSGVQPGPPTEFVDPTVPRPNDILPLHPAIIQQRQIAASLPPCSKGGYHELRTHQYV
ncbi:hypothetical protein BX616_001874 [Lobosporangium transversale]|uniref:Uncharacterized protein n=1 Tax=Lobosporangium transversale TaxID=64571 RepID=A0A1Y2GF82_9FUNG|nr:hypothetical protein BCR41DRAFT_398965 [Lobosporangium transversale]KAF9902605.1 hypothetical protein BX616_001874 [Lobosporangium transversale]ORZ09097.1 hypothetical protein BCR41DRAFT_398965 [Lobosporangium transversale]|eukprot:XP_021878724.1 hypothetical protein BCR41DRAFT_398965 [Lobosporangium transversale]